jgi:dTDP-4-dehydrorhamnose 3,5-epimerase-like enzyme
MAKLTIPFKEIKIKTFKDSRGSIGILNKNIHFKFDIKRIYFFQNTKNKIIRGFHSQKKNHCIFVPLQGKFRLKLLYKKKKYNKLLSAKSFKSVYIAPKVWREIETINKNFSCIIINSKLYDKRDYNFYKSKI